MNTHGAIKSNSAGCCCLTQRQCVVFIAVVETIGSLCGIVGFWYAYSTFPSWKQFMPLEQKFLSDSIILGLINTLIILCACGFIISLVLLDGALNVKLGQIRFWLTSMFTYKIVTSILIVGMQLAGCRAPKLNTLIFISIFLGFIEMLYVYAFLEAELRKRKGQILELKQNILSNDKRNQNLVLIIQTENSNGPRLEEVNCESIEDISSIANHELSSETDALVP